MHLDADLNTFMLMANVAYMAYIAEGPHERGECD